MENFKIESSELKLSYEVRAFITCVKPFFNKPDYQKLFNVTKDSGKHFFENMQPSL